LLFFCFLYAAGSGPERLEYKLNFYRAFEQQVRRLLSAGRHVIVVGDVNTAHRDVDIWAPAQFANSSGCLLEERRWMDGMIRSDINRAVVEERKQMQLQAQGATAAGGPEADAQLASSDDFDSSFLATLPLTAAAGGIVPASSLPDAAAAGAAAAASSSSAGTPAVAAFSSPSGSVPPAPAPLIDSFRYFHPFQRNAFTFWDMRTSRREGNLGWRIDYMLVDTALMLREVCGAAIHPAQKGSDHCPTSLQLRLPPLPVAAATAAAAGECDARAARIGAFLGLSPFPHPAPALAAKFRREFQVQSSTMLSFFRRAPSDPGAAAAKAAQEFTAAAAVAAAAGGAATASNIKKRKPTATSRARSLNSTLSAQQPSLTAMFAPSPSKKPKLDDQQQTAEKKEPETIVIDEPV
jgi:exonuclease III